MDAGSASPHGKQGAGAGAARSGRAGSSAHAAWDAAAGTYGEGAAMVFDWIATRLPHVDMWTAT